MHRFLLIPGPICVIRSCSRGHLSHVLTTMSTRSCQCAVVFVFNASKTNMVSDDVVYIRWIDTLTGGLDGEAECQGIGVWEQMYANKLAL
jgi:hypothetical protein